MELYGLVAARRRAFRRQLSVAAWVLAELQWIITRAVAKGISLALGGDRKPPEYFTSKEIFDRAPQFDVTVDESDDDGR